MRMVKTAIEIEFGSGLVSVGPAFDADGMACMMIQPLDTPQEIGTRLYEHGKPGKPDHSRDSILLIFRNTESLDVVARGLDMLRRYMLGQVTIEQLATEE